jgi:hypothetical protein
MKYTLLILISLLPTCLTHSGAADIVANSTNGKTYYHLKLSLKKDDFRLTWPEEWFNPQWPESTSGACEFSEASGHFIIFIKKSAFPVPAPNCNSDWLKLLMNGRSDDAADALTKKALWDRLLAVKKGDLLETTAVIELNPYVSVLNEHPLVVEMDYCNLNFRTAWGAYIDNLLPAPKHPLWLQKSYDLRP